MIKMEIRSKAGISGAVLCRRAQMGRSRLSDIERGYVDASPTELARLDAALNELIQAKRRVCLAAEEAGWPLVTLA